MGQRRGEKKKTHRAGRMFIRKRAERAHPQLVHWWLLIHSRRPWGPLDWRRLVGESSQRWLGGTQSQIICAGEGKSRRMTWSKSFIEFIWEVLCSFSSLLGRSREFGIVRGAKKRLCFCTRHRQRRVSLSNGKHA